MVTKDPFLAEILSGEGELGPLAAGLITPTNKQPLVCPPLFNNSSNFLFKKK